MFDDVTCGANNDRWNAILFQVTCNQTHGLVADRSDRCQDRDVYFILLTDFQRRRRRSLQHQLLTVTAIDVMELLRNCAYTSSVDIFLKPGQRQIRIQII